MEVATFEAYYLLRGSLFKIPPPPRKCLVLENLQVVSKGINYKLTRKVISKIPNVREMKLVYTSWSMFWLRNVVSFHQLEMLKLNLLGTSIMRIVDPTNVLKISDPFRVHYGLPTSLKKLSLRRM